MKKVFFVALLAVSILTAENFAQTAQISPTPTRQRVIIVGANPTPMPTPTATPIVAPTPS
ncbi:MAG: hypothetical protein ACR2IA_08655 [Pyrinomonadaceae bacterium]